MNGVNKEIERVGTVTTNKTSALNSMLSLRGASLGVVGSPNVV